MEIISAVLIGVAIGVLAGLRLIRSPLTFILIVASVLGIFGFMAVKSGGLRNPGDLMRVVGVIYLYGKGFLLCMALPGAASFGLSALIRSHLHSSDAARPAAKLRFTFICAACFGLFYVLYAVGLLLTSGGMDTGVVLRSAEPNRLVFRLMLIFGFDESIKAVPWLQPAYFTVAGTILYAALGGIAGYVWDVLRVDHERAA